MIRKDGKQKPALASLLAPNENNIVLWVQCIEKSHWRMLSRYRLAGDALGGGGGSTCNAQRFSS